MEAGLVTGPDLQTIGAEVDGDAEEVGEVAGASSPMTGACR